MVSHEIVKSHAYLKIILTRLLCNDFNNCAVHTYLMMVRVIRRSGHHSRGGRNGFVSVVNHLIHASHTTSIDNHINFVHLSLQSHGVIGSGASTCCTCVVIACHYASIGTCTFWSQRVIYMTHFNLCKSIAKNYLPPMKITFCKPVS